MRSATRVLLLLLATTLAVAPLPAADAIRLRNGRVLEGEIVSRDAGRIQFRSGGSLYSLAEADIVAIESIEPWKSALREGVSSLRGGNAVTGMEHFAGAAGSGADPDMIDKAMKAVTGSMLHEAGRLNGADVVAFRAALGQVAAREDLTTDTVFLAAQVYFESGDTEGGAMQLRRIDPAYFRGQPGSLRWVDTILRAEIRRLSNAARYNDAIETVSLLETLTGAQRDAAQPVVFLVQAASLREAGDLARCIQVLAESLAPTHPEIARNRLAIAVKAVKDQAGRTGDFTAATAALAPMRRRFPIELTRARAELALMEGRYLMERGDPAGAFTMLDATPPEERLPELEALLREADYQRRFAATDQNNPLAVFELATWAAGEGLVEHALELLRRARENESLRDLADKQIGVLSGKRHATMMEEALAFYDKGLLAETNRIVAELLRELPEDSPLREEARKLDKLSRDQMASEERRRPYLAEAFYQQAERDFFTGKYEESLQMLQTLTRQYADTPAAERARALLPDVLRNLEVAILEGRRSSMPRIDFDVSTAKLEAAGALDQELRALLEAFNVERSPLFDTPPQPTPAEPTPEPPPDSSAEPTPTPVPESTSDPAPAEPTPDPAPEPAPEPTPDPTPEPVLIP